ncbi:substrate-binding domain-containing protein [Rhodobacter ferrooxidans]|uniref:Phosphate ABC transporter, periplasmic binding protein n=1 Tax=Rhodobacter ferrooxidans TaxID=371731 RepID=C8RY31_9RHOB|nr:substrate-binding domain-containing protein [Rhodobacter sp. SW2]EEW26429.1 phosphate ABC transporter, periplasmic binding protein [Rhodobacter sp. SW2]
MSAMKLAASVLTIAAVSATAAAARDQVRVVGSSTVFPYAQAAAENFANATGMAAPVVESTGTGGGMKIFCEGIGEGFADVTNASRAMKKSEYELCAKNGVTDITEVMLGYDGLTLAVSRDSTYAWALTEKQIYQALAAEVDVDGKWVANPYKKWSEIDPSLPDVAIIAYGPPPTSGTRDAFVELAMHDGCKQLDYVKAMKETASKEDYDKFITDSCSRMRQDGPFVEAGENDNLIVQRIEADPTAVGIFGYSFLFENGDKLKGIPVDGVEPTAETIADFSYGVARPLFIYIKNAHRGVIPGLNEFVEEFVSDAAMGDGGYMQERGLTPLDAEKLAAQQAVATGAVAMTAPEK